MRSHPLVVLHDRDASRVPWEVLRIGQGHPALLAGVSRRYASDTLTVARWREDGAGSRKLRVLLVVNPTGDLPGAAAEGAALATLLTERGVMFDVLAGAAATRERILAALGAATFDVLHFAGHAYFDPDDPGDSGLVCHAEAILRGADLDGIGHLPALVFFNACEAARVRRPRTGKTRRPPSTRKSGLRRSASIAEAFLSGGVANFLGTHWPVEDAAALAFSRALYDALTTGAALGDAVLGARRTVATAALDRLGRLCALRQSGLPSHFASCAVRRKWMRRSNVDPFWMRHNKT